EPGGLAAWLQGEGLLRGRSRLPGGSQGEVLGGAPGGGIVLRRLALALLLLAALAAPGAAALRIPPPPDHRVNDYAGALAPADRDRLEQALIAREATSRNQVVVAIFRSLEGERLEDYSIRLAHGRRVRPTV